MSGTITVNGERTPLEAATITGLLRARGIGDERGVAVAVNGAVVPRPSWPERRLAPGDEVEIINIVGGG